MLPGLGNLKQQGLLSAQAKALPSLDSLNNDAIFVSSGNNDVIILALPAILLLGAEWPEWNGMEIQVFQNENSSQTNA